MERNPGFIRCSPHLPVANLQATIAYYQERLGFSQPWTLGEKDGGIQRDELRLLFAEDPEFARLLNNGRHRLPLIWFVGDIESVYAEFLKKGIECADPLRQHAYGLWEFSFIDLNGYYIRVSGKGREPEF